MTFLELCRAVGRDSGLISSQNQLASIAAATGGIQEKLVSFTRQAWVDIQNARTDWQFLKGSYSATLTIGKADYTPAELGIASRFSYFEKDAPGANRLPHCLYDPAVGVADTQSLNEISGDDWQAIYGRGQQTNSRPTEYALSGGKLYLGAQPDKAYALRGFYHKAPQELTADADVPECPTQFHDAIKWRAIADYSGADGAFADMQNAMRKYHSAYRGLVNNQTGPLSLGDALA